MSGYLELEGKRALVTRNTSVLSICPRTRSLPGPVAVRMASLHERTLALIMAGRLPKRSTAPGTPLYSSLALNVPG
jgi:hypothetical protein